MAITALGSTGLRFSTKATHPKRGRGAPPPTATMDEGALLSPEWGRVEARFAPDVARDGREWLDRRMVAWRRTP